MTRSSYLLLCLIVGVIAAWYSYTASSPIDDGQVLAYSVQEKKTAHLAAEVADMGQPDPAWRGKILTVAVLAGGTKGGISGPIYLWRAEWERITGAKLEIVEIPFAEMREKVFTNFVAEMNSYDIVIGPSWFYGDYIANGWIIPIDKYFNDPRMPKWNRAGIAPGLAKLLQWDNHWYGVFNDGDTQLLYYRQDVLTNPRWQNEFQNQYGYLLPVPPQTWQQVRDIAQFFHGRDWNGDGDADNGITLHLKVGGQSFFHFVSLSAPFSITPAPAPQPDRVDRYHNVYWFDPETMEPLINRPGPVRSLEFLTELSRYGSPAMLGWDLSTAWQDFLSGNAVMVFSFGDIGSLAQDPARSVIQGKLGAVGIPCSEEWYDLKAAQFVMNKTHPNCVGNLSGGSWHGVISAMSAQPDLAYHFLAWQATHPINFWNVSYGWTGINPGASWHFFPPRGSAKIEDFTNTGYNAQDAASFIRAYEANMFDYPITQSYLRIPGTPEYWEQLDIHVAEAVSGQMTPQEALDRTAQDWQRITNLIGREYQLKLYQTSIGYQP